MATARIAALLITLAGATLMTACTGPRDTSRWATSYTSMIEQDPESVDNVRVRTTDRVSSEKKLEINDYQVIGSAVFRAERLPSDWSEDDGPLVRHARSIGADLVLAREREIGTEMIARSEVGAPPPAAPQGGVGRARTGIHTTYEPVTLYEYVAWFYRSNTSGND